jgi:hypothetical protein
LARATGFGDFPGELIGDEEVDRIIASGDRNELEALLPRATLRRS